MRLGRDFGLSKWRSHREESYEEVRDRSGDQTFWYQRTDLLKSSKDEPSGFR